MREAYALWSRSYPQQPFTELLQMEHAAMIELLPELRDRRALDLACGSGRYLGLLAEAGAALFVGCDLSREMLSRAANLTSALACADLQALPFRDASFDVVVCGLAVGHLSTLAPALAEMGRVLRAGGVAVWSDVHPAGSRAGWRRTFQDQDGRSYAVRHYIHGLADHEAAAGAAGLRIEGRREPTIEFASRWRGYPAVLALRARKA